MPVYRTCPTCGNTEQVLDVKEFDGLLPVGAPEVPTLSQSLTNLVDGVIESSGYGSVH